MSVLHADLLHHTPHQYPMVSPRCVFAAGRKAFEVMVRARTTQGEAKAHIFNVLPLEARGWDFDKAKLSRIGIYATGVLWKIERGS